MIKVCCRTNLDDVSRCEQWPEYLVARPVVGDRIQSATKHGIFQLELEVYDCTWKCRDGNWYIEIELHIPKWGQPRSVGEWQEWYRKAKGLC